MRRFTPLALLSACFVLLAACAQATPEPAEFTVTMDEYSYSPDTIKVSAGQQVTIHLINNGTKEHSLMIGKDVVKDNGLPVGYQTNLFDSTGVMPQVDYPSGSAPSTEANDSGQQGFMVSVPVDAQEATISFTTTKDMVGTWEIGCFEENGAHYLAGMKGTFIVDP